LGMLVDFSEVKQAIRKTLDLLDHSLLNDLPAFGPEGVNPTAELIAQFLFCEFKQNLVLGENHLVWVKVFEAPDAWAIYKED
ncbi:6-carboxytetrahydropterin synthase, partial [Clostridium butyricum]|uniref:6-carboxytetrahydropterin synthase n=2 Tax=Eubacteriales TaxID=186802 RepID=UPI002102B29E